MKEIQEIQLNSYSYHNHHKLNLWEVIFTKKNNNYYFYHYQVFKINKGVAYNLNLCIADNILIYKSRLQHWTLSQT